MQHRWNKLIFACFIVLMPCAAFAQANFATSIHATREGKRTAYAIENGGMETITGIPMDSLGCTNCHATTYANGDTVDAATYEPGCNDCHDFNVSSSVDPNRCYACHSRQNLERTMYPDSLATGDVHRKAGMTCLSCHTKEEVHGDDGVAYASFLEPGAVKATCEGCHPLESLSSNSYHDVHAKTGAVSCTACHTQSVVACMNCHFESLTEGHVKRAAAKFSNMQLLVKRNGKVYAGTFMTHTYNGKTNYIVAPYTAHIIVKNAKTCDDCHNNMGTTTNAAINEYDSTGQITMARWDSTQHKLIGPSGVVPIPADWQNALHFDFLTYTGDPTSATTDPTKWELMGSHVDNGHLYYAEPLDTATMRKLGFTRIPGAEENIAPTLLSVRDVPADQGGWVHLEWSASSLDNDVSTLTHYTIWRSLPTGAAKVAGRRYRIARVGDVEYAWEQLSAFDQQAHRLSQYSRTVPTLYDSMSTTDGMHYFMVSAQTDDPNTFYDSNILGGYSVDDLAPAAPVLRPAAIAAGKVTLTWKPNTETDLRQYIIYRGTEAGFNPDAATALTMIADTSFVDENPPLGAVFYVIRAQDIHENLSLKSNEVEAVITDVMQASRPATFSLEQNVPNPFNPRTVIRFSVPETGVVELAIFDANGRLVRSLVSGALDVGAHEVIWNGRDGHGHNVSSGVYLYRLTSGGRTVVRKMVLVR